MRRRPCEAQSGCSGSSRSGPSPCHGTAPSYRLLDDGVRQGLGIDVGKSALTAAATALASTKSAELENWVANRIGGSVAFSRGQPPRIVLVNTIKTSKPPNNQEILFASAPLFGGGFKLTGSVGGSVGSPSCSVLIRAIGSSDIEIDDWFGGHLKGPRSLSSRFEHDGLVRLSHGRDFCANRCDYRRNKEVRAREGGGHENTHLVISLAWSG